MPEIVTSRFGAMEYSEESLITFPLGLPGFDDHRLFVCVENQATHPLVFLQSVEEDGLCFLALPVKVVKPDYGLKLSDDDASVLGACSWADASLVALAIVCASEGQPATANLLAPVVIHTGNRRAVQAVRDDALYSAWEPIGCGEPDEALC